VALLKNKNPTVTLAMIKDALTKGSTNPAVQFGIPSVCYGNGIVDAEVAYDELYDKVVVGP
jgi:hypothetical protein